MKFSLHQTVVVRLPPAIDALSEVKLLCNEKSLDKDNDATEHAG